MIEDRTPVAPQPNFPPDFLPCNWKQTGIIGIDRVSLSDPHRFHRSNEGLILGPPGLLDAVAVIV